MGCSVLDLRLRATSGGLWRLGMVALHRGAGLLGLSRIYGVWRRETDDGRYGRCGK